MIFQVVIKISMQMQAFNNPDCISMYTDCLHLHWNLSNQLHGHDQNLIMDGLHEAAGLDILYSLLLTPPGALHFQKGGGLLW